jgi:hypothetical protein
VHPETGRGDTLASGFRRQKAPTAEMSVTGRLPSNEQAKKKGDRIAPAALFL